MTLPQFAEIISSQNSTDIMPNHFEECVAVYKTLHKYFHNGDITISIESLKNYLSIDIKPINEVENILKLYTEVQMDLFNTHLKFKCKVIKRNALNIYIYKC